MTKTRAEVAAQIRAAWQDAVYPGDDDLVVPTYDDEGVGAYFRGRTWDGHDPKALEYHWGGLTFLTPRAFAYFLAAPMLAVVEGGSQRLRGHVAHALSPRALRYTWADKYRADIAALTAAQKAAACAFLQCLAAELPSRVLDDTDAIAAYLLRGEEPAESAELDELIAAYRDPTRITSLSWSNRRSIVRELAMLPRLPALAKLDLSHTELTDDDLTRIARCPALRVLELSGCRQITAAGLARLRALPALEELQLANVKLGDDGLRALGGLRLRRVNLVHCGPFSPQAWQDFAVDRLERLDGYGLDLPDEVLARLAANGGLTRLECSGASARGVAALGAASALQRLSLSERAEIDDAALVALARLPQLRELTFSARTVARWPSAPDGFPALEDLTLYHAALRPGCGLGQAGMRALSTLQIFGTPEPGGLAGVAKLPSLSRLTLWAEGLTDASLRDLAGAPALTELRVLRGPAVTAAGLAALAALPALTSLRLGDALPGLPQDALAALGAVPALTALELDHVRLSDEQVGALAALRRLGTLRLTSCAASPAAIERLRAALPGVELVAS